MLERPRHLKAERAQAMLLDPRLWGPTCPRLPVGRYAPTDTQHHTGGWGGVVSLLEGTLMLLQAYGLVQG